MGETGTGPRELSSWKEIASYLGVAVRTAQAWEHERGLPVRRLPGGRGVVLASVAELDAWKWSIGSATAAPTRGWLRVTVFAGFVLLAGLALLVGRVRAVPPQPASSSIQLNALVVFDDHGRELWRKMFPYSLGQYGEPGHWGFTWIGDLDGDGHQEVLFAPHPNGVIAQESTPLICYSDRGDVRWQFANARSVSSTDEEFSPAYAIARFIVTPLSKGGPNYVIAATTHTFYYPSQIALLTADGKLEREYWHSGHLNRIEAADLDGDGKIEIYAAGISNAWHAVTLVVLDRDHFGGASQEPQNPSHQLTGFDPGNERFRIVLERSCLGRLFPYNVIEQFSVRNGEILIETNEMDHPAAAGVFHHFSPDFRQHRVVFGDGYYIEYRRALLAGQPADCAADEQRLQGLRFFAQAR